MLKYLSGSQNNQAVPSSGRKPKGGGAYELHNMD